MCKGGSVVKNLHANTGDAGLIPGLGRFPGVGNGNTLQYSCQENSMTEEPGRLQSMGLQRVRLDRATNTFFSFLILFLCLEGKIQTGIKKGNPHRAQESH